MDPLGSNVTCLVTNGPSPNEVIVPEPVIITLFVSTESSSGAIATVDAHGSETDGVSPCAHSHGIIGIYSSALFSWSHRNILCDLNDCGLLQPSSNKTQKFIYCLCYCLLRHQRLPFGAGASLDVNTETTEILSATSIGTKSSPTVYCVVTIPPMTAPPASRRQPRTT